MKHVLLMTIAFAVAMLVGACTERPAAAARQPPSPAVGEANWSPGKDLAATQVVIGGVVQEVPPDVLASTRKLDAVAEDYGAQMDQLEGDRQKRFSADADIQAQPPESQ